MDSAIASYAHLKDFDWSVRMCLSSDKLSGLRTPLMILKLDVKLPCGKVEEVILELNGQELKNLLSSLKAAQLAVSFKK